jgi:hypothetical protein
MKRAITGTVASLLLLAGIVYAGDYVVLRYRMAKAGQVFGSVTVYRYYAVAEKNRKTEYVFDNAAAVTCVHSLFPHLGCSPCWYLQRHSEQRIEM